MEGGSNPPPAAWKNPSGAFENIWSGGPAERGKIHGDRAIFTGMTRVKGLGHGAKIIAQAATFGRGDAEGVGGLRGIQAAQFCAGGGAAKRAAGARGVKAVIVMARRNGFGDLAFHFHAHVVGQNEILAAAISNFSQRESGRQRWNRRMCEQSVHAIFCGGELRVVKIVGVNGNAIGEGGEAWRRLDARCR